jgi:hypothetical protein
MNDFRSRLGNIERQLTSFEAPKATNNSISKTTHSNSPTRNNVFFSPQQETQKKSSYLNQPYPNQSAGRPERPRSPVLDAAISDKICRTIDDLIQKHLFDNKSSTKSVVLSNADPYVSPSKKFFDASYTSPLYKSSVFTVPSEPLYKTEPYNPQSSSDNYNFRSSYKPTSTYEPYNTYDNFPKYENHSTYEPLLFLMNPFQNTTTIMFRMSPALIMRENGKILLNPAPVTTTDPPVSAIAMTLIAVHNILGPYTVIHLISMITGLLQRHIHQNLPAHILIIASIIRVLTV